MKPFRRVRKRDKPVLQEEQKEEPCQRIRKRDKPVLKKICYNLIDCCSGKIVCFWNKNDCLQTSVDRYSSSPTIYCPDTQFCGHNVRLAESTAVSLLDEKECYLFAQNIFSCMESVEQLEKAG